MSKEQNKLMSFYWLILISIIFNFVPSFVVQTMGLLMFLVFFIGLYIMRAFAQKSGLTFSHSHFIIKSIWISTFLLLIGAVVAGVLGDHTIINNAVDTIKNGTMISEQQFNSLIMQYGRTNFMLFLGALSPSVLYVLYRLAKGMKVLKRNENIANPKSWF